MVPRGRARLSNTPHSAASLCGPPEEHCKELNALENVKQLIQLRYLKFCPHYSWKVGKSAGRGPNRGNYLCKQP